MDADWRPFVEKYPDLAGCLADIQQAAERLLACYRRGGKLLACGNGGSAADAEHLVAELMKGYRQARPLAAAARRRLVAAFPDEGPYLADHLQGALPAIALVSQAALITATANDIAADLVFAQQVYGYGAPGDVLIAISTSGNSPNVLQAARVARAFGLEVIGFTGRSGGALQAICDVTVRVPYDETDAIQERQLPIYHLLCAVIEAEFFQPEA